MITMVRSTFAPRPLQCVARTRRHARRYQAARAAGGQR
jgi:hypothetical protein